MISKYITVLLFANCIGFAEKTKNSTHIELLDRGYNKVNIRHDSNVNGVDISIVCRSRGSAFRRCSVEIFCFRDGELSSLFASTFNASTVKLEEKNGMLDIISAASGEILTRINLKYIVISNEVLVDDSTKKTN
jgi:hypothetical protein